MSLAHQSNRQDKISREFRSRLERLSPNKMIRAIVLLQTPVQENASGQRQTRSHRHAAIEAVKQATEKSLPAVDTVLNRLGGRRLAEHASALGSVPVEATVAGIKALADLEQVKAILEDQPISLLTKHL